MDWNTNDTFIVISVAVSLAFTYYCYSQLKSKWGECTTFYSPNGSEKDYTILKDIFSRILLIGGSVFLILHSVYFGIFDEWLIKSMEYGKTVIILIGAFSYMIYVTQNSINAVNSAINKKVAVNKFHKPDENKKENHNEHVT